MCANRISTFLRSRRDCWNPSVLARGPEPRLPVIAIGRAPPRQAGFFLARTAILCSRPTTEQRRSILRQSSRIRERRPS